MVREASGLIRHLTAVLLVVVRFPLIDSLESAGAQPLANNSMLVSGESVDSSDDYDSSTITTRPNNTLLFDAINSNASLFFPRTLLDEAVGPLHDEAPVVPNVAHVNVPVGYLIGLSIGVCLLLFSMGKRSASHLDALDPHPAHTLISFLLIRVDSNLYTRPLIQSICRRHKSAFFHSM